MGPERGIGKQFDPNCAAAFLRMREQVLVEMRTLGATAVLVKGRNGQRECQLV